MIVDVLVEIKTKQMDHTFTYLLPYILEYKVFVGSMVLVTIGKRELEGLV